MLCVDAERLLCLLLPVANLLAQVVEDGVLIAEAHARGTIVGIELYVVVLRGDDIAPTLIYEAVAVVVRDNDGAILEEVRGAEVYILDNEVAALILEAYAARRGDTAATTNNGAWQ